MGTPYRKFKGVLHFTFEAAGARGLKGFKTPKKMRPTGRTMQKGGITALFY